MIDYKGLHAKIKAQLKPDSPMPEGWEMIPERQIFGAGWFPIATQVEDGVSVEAGRCYYLNEDWQWCLPACIEWFANALGIPLEDNGYTDLVKAAELQLKLDDQIRAAKTNEEIEAWSDYANDGEISLRAALERIKNEVL